MFENERAGLNKTEPLSFADAAWNGTTWFIDAVGHRTIGRGFEDLMAFGVPTIKKFKDDKSICLTFDDGPNPRTLSGLLSELRKQKVRATFFCVGRYITQNPSLAKAICGDGHEIANHTMSHVDLYRVSPATSLREIALCQDAIESVCGVRAQSFRAPWGHFRSDLIRAKRFGIKHFAKWDTAPQWSLTDPQAIARHILSSVGGGSIILLHDWLADRQPEVAEAVGLANVKAIDLFVPKLKDLGYSFRTFSEQATMSSAVTRIKFG
jgi:peptidoglycan/xylan/chitin deacetylase (PgdA/CDA1 family)